MDSKNQDLNNTKTFNTDSGYAIVAGWLVLPAIGIILSFINTLAIILTVNLANYPFLYIVNVIYLILYLIIIYAWLKRKRILPKLMMVLYGISIIFSTLFIIGAGPVNNEWMSVIASAIWIGYFLKSQRVKQTFVH
ncbi:DUF2569 family protein [Lentibacillus sp. L22]|uniref:DUF2569 family protein n=1 Tax=Lentibacillus TaxID=175304 RepID=UPI0022B20042|nr:DUF2569 family protein [Lentibacillus daqui]